MVDPVLLEMMYSLKNRTAQATQQTLNKALQSLDPGPKGSQGFPYPKYLHPAPSRLNNWHQTFLEEKTVDRHLLSAPVVEFLVDESRKWETKRCRIKCILLREINWVVEELLEVLDCLHHTFLPTILIKQFR